MSATFLGGQVLLEENHDLPLIRVQLSLRAGAATDPDGKEGLCNFAAELLARGAAGKNRAELDAAFDALGSSLEISTDYDGTVFEVTVLKEKLDPVLALIADVLLRPEFSEVEAEKLQRELVAQLDELRDDDGSLARRFLQRSLYGAEHPYGRSVLGTESSIAHFDADSARAWHRASLRSDSMIFGAAGAISADEFERALTRHFSALPRVTADNPSPAIATPPDPKSPRGIHITLVDKPERTQSQIVIGEPAPAWSDPSFAALQVATCAFGGTFTARLMNEVRSKRGLSYGAGARLGFGRGRRALVMNVFPSLEQTAETVELVLKLFHDWVKDGVTDEEVEFARGYLQRSFAFSIATPEDRLDLRAAYEIAGMPPDWLDQYVPRIGAVRPEEARRALREKLRPADLEVCIVTTAEKLLPLLRPLGHDHIDVVSYESY